MVSGGIWSPAKVSEMPVCPLPTSPTVTSIDRHSSFLWMSKGNRAMATLRGREVGEDEVKRTESRAQTES